MKKIIPLITAIMLTAAVGAAAETPNYGEFQTEEHYLISENSEEEGTSYFESGYPRLSSDGVFNNITVELKTSVPCTVYYALAEEGNIVEANIPLCEIYGNKSAVKVNIVANINKVYDLYLRAVPKNGAVGKQTVIKSVRAFIMPQGKGTAERPYIVFSEEQLARISDMPDKHYRLGSDIVLTKQWTTIEKFTGMIDGNGYKISNLFVDAEQNSAGFIGNNFGTVKNLSVDGTVNAKNRAGIIVGKNFGEIDGCTACGSVNTKENRAGGICGDNSGEISNSLAVMYSVSAGVYSGGVCGYNTGTVENCLSAANEITAGMYAGGISGMNRGGKISGCVCADMDITAEIDGGYGRIATNSRDGITENNYCYAYMSSNLNYGEIGEDTQNGEDITWEECIMPDFFYSAGWNKTEWKTAGNGFRLLCPASAAEPASEAGRTVFLPKKISDAKGLMEIDANEAGHYILTKNIALDVPWKTVCAREGFSGTLDGNGYSIFNLNLKLETGMFSNITGGTIRNLKISNARVMPDVIGSVIAACNYGYIENCTVSAEVDGKKGVFGGIAAENFGQIKNCSVRINMKDRCDNSTIGGICADNSGIVIGSYAALDLKTTGENTVVGGIVGYDTGGGIFESFAGVKISAKNKSGYYAGVCAMAERSSIYKCASSGTVSVSGKSMYAGGICAMSDAGVIYNCYSLADISSSSPRAYVGGIVGYAGGESNIQNTYATGNIVASGGAGNYAAGICAYAENSFAMQNVSANPSISSTGFSGGVCAYCEYSEIGGNFSCAESVINSKHPSDGDNNGKVKTLQVLKNDEFYFRPTDRGGLLGWDNENVWAWKNNSAMPYLRDVAGQDNIKFPTYR